MRGLREFRRFDEPVLTCLPCHMLSAKRRKPYLELRNAQTYGRAGQARPSPALHLQLFLRSTHAHKRPCAALQAVQPPRPTMPSHTALLPCPGPPQPQLAPRPPPDPVRCPVLPLPRSPHRLAFPYPRTVTRLTLRGGIRSTPAPGAPAPDCFRLHFAALPLPPCNECESPLARPHCRIIQFAAQSPSAPDAVLLSHFMRYVTPAAQLPQPPDAFHCFCASGDSPTSPPTPTRSSTAPALSPLFSRLRTLTLCNSSRLTQYPGPLHTAPAASSYFHIAVTPPPHATTPPTPHVAPPAAACRPPCATRAPACPCRWRWPAACRPWTAPGRTARWCAR